MSMIAKQVSRLRAKARAKRRQLFLDAFQLGPDTTILDLGSEDGTHIHQILAGSGVRPENVTIADIHVEPLMRGRARYGYNTCTIAEEGKLPFPDNQFDLVFSNSVIEHVTVPKEHVWSVSSTRDFRSRARKQQAAFAEEVRRVGRGYFVQTPNRWFLIESHSWLPAFGWLPREVLVPALRITNRFWLKKTAPDWALLSKTDMKVLFPDADIRAERLGPFVKSLIAVKHPADSI